jgi:4-aminobutyrate aminotransferase
MSSVPDIRTPLPGPKSRALIELDEQYTSPSYTRVYPLAVARGMGAVIEDLDGNRFLDFNAGIAVCATGHCHPRIVAAIRDQSEKLLHMSGTDFYYPPQARLAEKLAQIAPGEASKRVFFTNSGTEAVEAAIKLARYHTGRSHVIGFYGAFHGRTLGSLSLTSSKIIQRRKFGPLLPCISHISYPNCYRCPENRSGQRCCLKCLDELEQLFRHTVPPEEVAAIFVEPIQGEGGYLVPPPEFHPRLREITQEHGILYVADEVQSGMGRTGKMMAVQHWDVVPDIICLAKGIASGMPLGAIVASEETMNWPSGSHASTFGGNPISCQVALETIALLEEELIDNAARMGDLLMSRLAQLKTCHPIMGDIRGRGLMVGVEIVADCETRQPAPELRNALIQSCFHKGLLLLGCGTSTVRFCPPLIISREDVETAIRIFDQALNEKV